MDYKELNQVLANLDQAMVTLEDAFMESEGECTEATDQTEQEIACLQELLTRDGIDLLGGWLKAKEDRKKALKAEKDYLTRQMSAIDETIDFVKAKVNQVLGAIGQDKVKGDRGYSFTAVTSRVTEVNKDVLKDRYAEKIGDALRSNGIPAYIKVTLSASASEAANGVLEGDETIFNVIERPSVRFVKPRASKEA